MQDGNEKNLVIACLIDSSIVPVTSPPCICPTGIFICAPVIATAILAPMSKPDNIISGFDSSKIKLAHVQLFEKDLIIAPPLS